MINLKDAIGLNELAEAISKDCKKAPFYSATGILPHHKLVYLDEHQGRTTALECIADCYKEYGVLDFYSSLDDYIEVKFRGSYNDYCDGASLIRSAADYSNIYQGIIGIDAISLVQHRHENQWDDFLSLIEKLSKSAVLVFFVEKQLDKQSEFYVSTLKSKIRNLDEIYISDYSSCDYAKIIAKYLSEKGFNVDNNALPIIRDIVESNNIESVTQALELCTELSEYANYSVIPPIISRGSFKNYGGIS